MDRLFGALADRTRRDIVVRVLREEATVSGLARGYAMSFAAVQKHVAVLERAGLVTKERRGREVVVRPGIEAVRSAAALLLGYESLWRGRLDRFERLLQEEDQEAAGATTTSTTGTTSTTSTTSTTGDATTGAPAPTGTDRAPTEHRGEDR